MKSLFAFIHCLFWGAVFAFSKPGGEPDINTIKRRDWLAIAIAVIAGVIAWLVVARVVAL